jgi:membrane-associated protein
MDLISQFIGYFLHLDQHLGTLVANYGSLTYVILFLIVFCETGLVVTPFLPGDSLLFAAGAIAATSSNISINLLALILVLAAILGDGVNYFVGSYIGDKAFYKYPKIFRPIYLIKTREFYEKYGNKTIIIARFIPIVRTFAPFLAGVGKMSYLNFAIYNIVGALLWIGLFLYGGYFFANIPIIKRNFSIVIIAIIFVSVLPAVFEFIKARKKSATTN